MPSSSVLLSLLANVWPCPVMSRKLCDVVFKWLNCLSRFRRQLGLTEVINVSVHKLFIQLGSCPECKGKYLPICLSFLLLNGIKTWIYMSHEYPAPDKYILLRCWKNYIVIFEMYYHLCWLKKEFKKLKTWYNIWYVVNRFYKISI